MNQKASAAGRGEPEASHFHRGANQSGMRDHNQRVVLSLVRQYGALSKSDVARMAEVSAQTASMIMRELEDDGLLLRGEPVRGKIGQPSVPMRINPEGALFIGLKIGRRSADMVLIDFLGRVRALESRPYPYPTPEETLDFAMTALASLQAGLTSDQKRRIGGMGIAMPFELWNWEEQSGAPSGAMDAWRTRDIRAELQDRCNFPIYTQNDATSACGAELVFGDIGRLRTFAYFYIGAFAGGGIVLNGRLHAGPSGNAGALGSMPVPNSDGHPVQLIDIASLAILERDLVRRGESSGWLWSHPDNWNGANPDCTQWLEEAGRALAYATVAATAVIDFEAAIIDGWMPPQIRAELVKATRQALATIDIEGIAAPLIREGTVGAHARAIGAASLPLSERYLVGALETLGR